MRALDYLVQKFNLDLNQKMPIEIPNVSRDSMALWFSVLGFKTGAEIGVEQGHFSELLCRRIPGLRLFCIDAWRAYSGYREHVSQDKLDGFYETTVARLADYNATIIRKYSMDAVRDFKPHSLDFVYIDANHGFKWVAEDIYEWEKIVKPGGIIAGHDYCKRKENGYQVHVVEVVNAYTQAFHISPWFVLGSKNIVEGELRDRPRSWMWVVK